MKCKQILAFFSVLAAAFAAGAQAPSFRAAQVPAPALVVLDNPQAKAARPATDAAGRLRVGDVLALAKAVRTPAWTPVAGGWTSRFTVTSVGASGIRARLDLGSVPGMLDVRVRGAGEVESMSIDPRLGPEWWTPFTEGDTQVVELFSAIEPAADAARVGAISHFTASPMAKASGSCTVPGRCTTEDAALDAAIAVAKKSVMRITFVDGGGSFQCSATLIDTPRNPAAYVMTANHCVDNASSAQSIASFWFYENATCDAGSASTRTQVAGGMQLVFGNHNVDATLLLMNGAPPVGAVYAPTNPAEMRAGEAMVSLSHPAGDPLRLALGNVTQQYRLIERPQDFNAVRFTRGIIQGGSSGSGAFTLANGALQFRGTLLGTTLNHGGDGMSCTNTDEEAIYGRFDIFAPQIAQYIGTALAADDAPNRPQDLFAVSAGTPLDQRANGLLSRDGLRIDYAGDLDTIKFTLSAPAIVSAWSEGTANLDTVGSFLDGVGSWLDSNDDAGSANNHFGLTRALDAGTYYLQVGHFEPGGTGAYNVRIKAERVEATNYTDLWSTPGENGWGINLNHQGNTIFASLFTYDEAGAPMWLSMSNGDRQADGSYQGTLYRGTGGAFNASPWRAPNLSPVGTMRLVFASRDQATLTYTFNGVPVTKSIARFEYATPPTCTWSAFDRTYDDNFQDLWLVPSEPGWGLNITHQDDTLFASLFTYEANGRDVWLVMSNGDRTGNGRYAGMLYRTSGPAFNASPWVAAQATAVGNMGLQFSDGSHGTLTYTYNNITVTRQIQRYVFGSVRPSCAS